MNFYVFFSKVAKKGKKVISRLLYPDDYKCIFCGKDIPNFYERPYCADCAKELPFNNSHRCQVCDQPIYNEATVCDFCQKQKRFFKKAFCPFLYKDLVRKQILAYKDSNRRYLAKGFAIILARALEGLNIDVITYIPMTEKKQKQRSFNQAKLLAEALGLLLGKRVLCLFEKTRDDKAQKELSYRERHEKMIGTYVLKPAKLKKDENVLIVDDILTTCATANYCSGLLYPKVNNIYVACIARDVPQNPTPI